MSPAQLTFVSRVGKVVVQSKSAASTAPLLVAIIAWSFASSQHLS